MLEPGFEEHIDEESLDLVKPPAGLLRRIREIRILRKPSKIFFRCHPAVPSVSGCQKVYTLLDAVLCRVIHLVKKLIEMLPDQLPQAMVRYCLMKYGRLHVGG